MGTYIRGFLLVLGFVLGVSASVSAEMTATELQYFTEDYPPYNFEEAGEMRGISVDLLRLIWKEMDIPEQPIRLVPWARGYRIVQNRPGTVLFAMGRTADREDLFRWVCPIMTNRQVLIGRKDQNIQIQSLAEAKRYRIGTILKDLGDSLLTQAGFDNLESVSDIRLNLRKLDAGRIDLIAYGENGFWNHVENPEDYEIVFALKTSQACYAFHQDTPEALVADFQRALDAIKTKGMHKVLIEEYFGAQGME